MCQGNKENKTNVAEPERVMLSVIDLPEIEYENEMSQK